MSDPTKKYIFTKSFMKEKKLVLATNYLNYDIIKQQDYHMFNPYKRDPMLYIRDKNHDTWLYENKYHELIFSKLYLNYNL